MPKPKLYFRTGSPREVFFERPNDAKDTGADQRNETGVFPTIRATHYKSGDNQPVIARTIRVGGTKSPHGSKQNWDSYKIEGRIRRLAPKECERLMSWPDDWTRYGNFDGVVKEISDTQRYKMCGNGVVSKVVEKLAKVMVYS